MVRAKFYVAEISVSKWDGEQKSERILLRPVVGGSEENKKFYEYTPAGMIELTVLNPDAAKQFELGGEYLVDFTPAQ